MKINKEETDKIIKYYTEDLESLQMIAERYGTYVNKIRRLLIKCGVKIRTFGESQKLALDIGRNEHPTKGKKRTEEEKEKISLGVYETWENFSEDKRKRLKKEAKERWENKSEKEREELSLAAKKAMQKAAVNGSKMENFLREEFEKVGIPVIFHKKDLVKNTNLEVDIFIPSHNTAIEIDGPTHFLPIFGEERLVKTMESDKVKIGLLMSAGYNILRVKCLVKNVSRAFAKKVSQILISSLEDMSDKKSIYKEIEV